jgi:hypothetical protein
MKADLINYDFVGTVTAEVSDFLVSEYGDNLESFGKYFNLDLNRFKVIGLSIYGTKNYKLSLICVDKKKSTNEKEHKTSISIDIEDNKDFLSFLFKRLNFVLHSRRDSNCSNLSYDEEANYEDYHENKK